MDITTAGVYIALIAGVTTVCVYSIGMRAHRSFCNEEYFHDLIGQINDTNECLLAKLDQVHLHCEQCNKRTLGAEAVLVDLNKKLNEIYHRHNSTSDTVQYIGDHADRRNHMYMRR